MQDSLQKSTDCLLLHRCTCTHTHTVYTKQRSNLARSLTQCLCMKRNANKKSDRLCTVAHGVKIESECNSRMLAQLRSVCCCLQLAAVAVCAARKLKILLLALLFIVDVPWSLHKHKLVLHGGRATTKIRLIRRQPEALTTVVTNRLSHFFSVTCCLRNWQCNRCLKYTNWKSPCEHISAVRKSQADKGKRWHVGKIIKASRRMRSSLIAKSRSQLLMICLLSLIFAANVTLSRLTSTTFCRSHSENDAGRFLHTTPNSLSGVHAYQLIFLVPYYSISKQGAVCFRSRHTCSTNERYYCFFCILGKQCKFCVKYSPE